MNIHRYGFLILIILLVSCGGKPASTPHATEMAATPQATRTLAPTGTFTPVTQPTEPPTLTPLATATIIPFTVSSVQSIPPTGWKTFVNEYLGYQFYYSSTISIRDDTFIEWSDKNIVPRGFTEGEYSTYIYQVSPGNLCLSFGSSAGWVTIRPPSDSIGRLVEICPGMGLGPIDHREQVSETFQVNGRSYLAEGIRIFFTDNPATGVDLFGFYVDGGFQVIISTGQPKDVPLDNYVTQRELLKQVLATLTWTRVPDLTMPGTTCAGMYTHLLPHTYAIVAGKPDDPPNRVRLGPGKTDEMIAQIYPQTIVKVLEGPVCADGLVFWKVENTTIPGGVGWTAEGDGKNYWLEPYKP